MGNLFYSLFDFSLCLKYSIYLILDEKTLKKIMSLTDAVIFKKQQLCKNNMHNRGALAR